MIYFNINCKFKSTQLHILGTFTPLTLSLSTPVYLKLFRFMVQNNSYSFWPAAVMIWTTIAHIMECDFGMNRWRPVTASATISFTMKPVCFMEIEFNICVTKVNFFWLISFVNHPFCKFQIHLRRRNTFHCVLFRFLMTMKLIPFLN